MAIFETFSKRLKKRERVGQPDVFQYDDLPREFRVQVIHIWCDAIGRWEIPQHEWGNQLPNPGAWWNYIESQMSRELGMFNLSERGPTSFEMCQDFMLVAEPLHALDLIELSFRVIDRNVRQCLAAHPCELGLTFRTSPDQAISELNDRFLEHAIGYEFVAGELIRKDSQFIHAEAVRPALHLLAAAKFRGANEEFLRAHEHYRHGRHEEAMQDALKAFESTLKTICELRNWPYQPTDAAKALIAVVVDKGLIPTFLTSELPALVTVLESSLPTVRNKLAGHGAGSVPREVPAHFAAFALHLAASNIVMLVEAHRAMK